MWCGRCARRGLRSERQEGPREPHGAIRCGWPPGDAGSPAARSSWTATADGTARRRRVQRQRSLQSRSLGHVRDALGGKEHRGGRLAQRCEVQVAYAIGVAEPVSVMVDTFGTGTVPQDALEGPCGKSSISRLAASSSFEPAQSDLSAHRGLRPLRPGARAAQGRRA